MMKISVVMHALAEVFGKEKKNNVRGVGSNITRKQLEHATVANVLLNQMATSSIAAVHADVAKFTYRFDMDLSDVKSLLMVLIQQKQGNTVTLNGESSEGLSATRTDVGSNSSQRYSPVVDSCACTNPFLTPPIYIYLHCRSQARTKEEGKWWQLGQLNQSIHELTAEAQQCEASWNRRPGNPDLDCVCQLLAWGASRLKRDSSGLSKTLTVDELIYLKGQFALLEPSKSGCITLENIEMALMKNATDAMKESRVQDFLVSLSALQYRRMDFDEFCAAALSVYQLEGLDRWEQHARCAYVLFEKDGNRAIFIDELASFSLGYSGALARPFYSCTCCTP